MEAMEEPVKKKNFRNSSKSDVSWLIALAKAKFETAKTRLRFTGQQTVFGEAKVKREGN